MRANSVRTVFAEGRVAINGWMSIGSPYVGEVLGAAGYDAVTVDLQHGMFGRGDVPGMLQAIATSGAMPMVRATSLDPSEIGWLLDAGAYGLICPSIDSAAQAAQLVAACHYPPRGIRSFGPARGVLYGGPDYVDNVGELLIWAMVESAAALDCLADILATPGLDGVYLGPNDLALSLGLAPGGPIQGRLAEEAQRIVDAAHRHGRFAGLFCADGGEAARWAAAGFDLVTPGNDVSLLRASAASRIGSVRNQPEAPRASGY